MAGDSSWCCRNPHGQNLKNKAAGSVAAAAVVVAAVVVAGVVGVMAGEGRELGYLFITETHSLSCFSNLGRKEGKAEIIILQGGGKNNCNHFELRL